MSKLQRFCAFPTGRLLLLALFVWIFQPTYANENTNQSFAKKILVKVELSLQQTVSIISNQSNTSTSAAMPCPGGAGVIGGKVVGDFNYDGVDNQDAGIGGVEVFLYGCDNTGSGSLLASTRTDGFGDYFFNNLTDGVQYRLEFVSPDKLQYIDGRSGTAGGPSVQFITSPSCAANASFTNPDDFCQGNPGMASTCFVNGDPLPAGSEAANIDALVYFNWEDEGNSLLPDELANAGEIGAAYGLAFDRETKTLYTSAFIKRFVGLGTLGIGGIYTMTINDANPTSAVPIPFVDVETIGIDVGSIPTNVARELPTQLEDPSNDAVAYDKVATEGIGAITFLDGKLWMVNLFDKNIYSIEVDSDNNAATAPTGADVEQFTLPNANCSNGEFRPFAITDFRGKIYIGGVCDASGASGTESDLRAIVYEMTGATFTEILSFDLDYHKGYAASANNCENFPGWYPWIFSPELPPTCDNNVTYIYPTPVLSDIAFDIDGSLMLGFMDRMGHQLGNKNYPLTGTLPLMTNISGGDLLRAFYDAENDTYILESNGDVGTLTSLNFLDANNNIQNGTGNGEGPGGGEFYFQDIFSGPADNFLPPPHVETSQGDLAFYPGAGRVATTALDPYSTLFNTGGVNYMSNTSGQVRLPGFRLYQTSNSSISTFSKANGLGALITLCDIGAPLEIGGYLWDDANANGIQDPCEFALQGINLTLLDNAGNELGTTNTAVDGTYNFNETILNSGTIQQNTAYHIIAGTNGQFDPLTQQLNGQFFVTNPNIGGGQNPDKTDSDAAIAGIQFPGNFTGFPFITIGTGGAGFVDHSYDFGFTDTNVNPTAGIGGTVFEDFDNDGINNTSDGSIEGIEVSLFDGDLNLVGTTTTNSNGDYFFINIDFGDYYVEFNPTSTITGATYQYAPQNQGGDDDLDSDPDPLTGRTMTFNFDPDNGDITNIDAGYFLPEGNIGGAVFEDVNNNGIQDVNEPFIQGVEVTILDADNNNSLLDTDFSEVDGSYLFTNLGAGNYIVQFDISTNLNNVSNYQVTVQNAGTDDDVDSDISSAQQSSVITYDPSNGNIDNLDAGYFAVGMIEGFVWNDSDIDGIFENGESPISGVLVTLLDENGSQITTTTTDTNGEYSFPNQLTNEYSIIFDPDNTGNPNYLFSPQDQGNNENLDSDANPANGAAGDFLFTATSTNNAVSAGIYLPKGNLGGLVFADANGNGVQDTFEAFIQGATIMLLDADNNNAVVFTTTTNSSGGYIFTGLENGNYIVSFDVTTNIAGVTNYQVSPQNQGNDNDDSDVDPNTGLTDVIPFDPLQGDVFNVDAGFFQTASIGGLAFGDSNENGLLDMTEVGIPNVGVQLFDANDNLIGTTSTASNGTYSFPNLLSGTYYVVFDPSTTGNTDFEYAPQNVGNDDAVDSDGDDTGRTNDIVFNSSAGDNNTVFIGLSLPFGNITGQVFKDCNQDGIQDADEAGIENAVIVLNDTSGNPFGTPVLTNAMGFYTIMNVQTGSYTINFSGPDDAVGLALTSQDSGNDDTIDSDADPVTGNTAAFTVGSSGTIENIDAGFIDNLAPIVTNIPDLTVGCEEDITSFVKALDNCDDEPSLFFEDVQISGTCPIEIVREWTTSDDCGNTETYTQKLTINDTTAPVIIVDDPVFGTLQNGDTILIECSSTMTFDQNLATITDNCDADLTVTFDNNSTIGECDDDGFFERMVLTWAAEDNCGNATTFVLTVLITDMTPPVVVAPQDLTVDCNSIPPVPDLIFSDNCDNDLTVDFEEILLGDTCEIYKIIRSWFIYDDCLNVAWAQQKILVEVDNLEITDVPDDITIECDEDKPVFGEVTATNDCSLVSVDTMTLILDDDPCVQQCVRVWTATDECGHTETATQLITIEDNTPPVLEFDHPLLIDFENGDSITFNCDDAVVFDENSVVATDNCNEVNVQFMEMFDIGDCETDSYLVRMECCWKADDGCGNQSELCIIVRITDDVKPILAGVPDDITINQAFEDLPLPADVTATDACDENVDIELVENQTAAPDGCGFTLTRTWTATDDCGNTCTDTQIITVDDVCDCPNILLNDVTVTDAECAQNNGSITVDVSIDPIIYDYILIPNLGENGNGPNEFINLPPGSYVLIINLDDFPDCDEKIFFDIEEESCTDMLQVTIQEQDELCLTSDLIDFGGSLTTTEMVNTGNPATVECTGINGQCIELTPAAGFAGTADELISVVHCFNNDPDQCDTTLIEVTVDPILIDCELEISELNIIQPDCDNPTGSVEVLVSGNQGNLIYDWSPAISNTNIGSDLTAGNYVITIIDEDTDCEIIAEATINNIEMSNISLDNITAENVACFGESTGSITSTNGAVYTVTNADGFNAVTPTNNLPVGTYTVTESTADCSSSVEIEITQNTELSVDIATTPESCDGNDGAIQLTVSGGIGDYAFNWSSNTTSTTNEAFGLVSTEVYHVTITDDLGCEEILKDIAVGNDCTPCALNLTTVEVIDAACGTDNGSITVSATGINGMLTYSWLPNVSDSETATDLAPGTYTITAMDGIGCESSITVVIDATPLDWAATATTENTTCGADDGTIAIVIDGGNGLDFTYDWMPDVTTDSIARDLQSGDYSVIVTDQNGCSMTVQSTVEDSNAQFSVAANVVNESCAGNDGAIQLAISPFGDYDIVWSDNALTGDTITGLTNGDVFSVTVTNDNGCTIELTDITVELDCQQTTSTENVFIECGATSAVLCISTDELYNDLGGVTVLDQPVGGMLGFVSDICFSYTSMPDFTGDDLVSFVACDMGGVCDTTYFAIEVEECIVVAPCEDFISDAPVTATVPNCDDLAAVCLKIPFEEALTYEIYDDGVEYTLPLESCLVDTLISYDANLITEPSVDGPFDVTWNYAGGSTSNTVVDIDQLVNFLNTADPTGNWTLNSDGILSGRSAGVIYGTLDITYNDGNTSVNLDPENLVVAGGTVVQLTVGTHELVFIDEDDCTDTLQVTVNCITTSDDAVTVMVDSTITYCFDNVEVLGTPGNLQVICNDCVIVDLNEVDECVDITGLTVGSTDATLVICDDVGFCDTLNLAINVVNNGLLPIARIDGDTTQMNEEITIPVLTNDDINGTLFSLNIVDNPANGVAQVVGNSIIYVPTLDFCGLDAFSYEVCNENGCDLATVNLLITCLAPKPVSGFSPNGDGINDGFLIKNIEMFPDNEVIIYDRWGMRVFSQANYNNGRPWEGEYRTMVLPDGTYFYILRYGDGEKMTGYVQIQR